MNSYLGEAALHCEVGARKVLRHQLDHLLEVNRDLPNVDLRVLPWSASAHPALGRNFTILHFPGATEAEMIFSENVAFFVLQDDEDEVRTFQLGGDGTMVRAVRDSKDPTGPALVVDPTKLTSFIEAVKHGSYG